MPTLFVAVVKRWRARREAPLPTLRLRLQRAGEMPLQHGGGRGVGLLQIHAPVLQFVERDRVSVIAQRTKVPGEITRKSPSRYCTCASPWPEGPNLFSTVESLRGRPLRGNPGGHDVLDRFSIDRVACPPGKPTGL